MWVHKYCESLSETDFNRLSKIPISDSIYVCKRCASDAASDVNINEKNSECSTNENIWTPFKNRGLHLLHLNINSILPKIDELREIAKVSKATIIGISESKLDESILDDEIDIPGYKVFRADRNRNGGGVACYIKSDVARNVRKDFSNDIENLFLDIFLPNSKPILVGIIYRPPDQSGFLSKLTDAINSKKFDEQEVYILGDLNMNILEDKCIKYPSIYTEFCSLHGLKQIIKTPTRVTENTATLLDHILTNSTDRVSQSGVIEIGLSDHMLTYCTRKISKKKFSEHKFIHIRSMKNYTQEKYTQALREIKFPNYSDFLSVENFCLWKNLYGKMCL